MTEKRFGMIKSEISGLYVIVDEQKEYSFGGIEDEYDCMRIVNVLNNLYDMKIENGKIASAYLKENEQLKSQRLQWITNQQEVECLTEENEQLKNKIDVLEDDNETYHKSLEKLNLYTKRFIPTKCTNEFKDCKTNRYYWLDYEGNFTGCLELLNLLDCEREVLESENRQLKGRLMEYEEQLKGDVE